DISVDIDREPNPLTATKLPMDATTSRRISRTDLSSGISPRPRRAGPGSGWSPIARRRPRRRSARRVPRRPDRRRRAAPAAHRVGCVRCALSFAGVAAARTTRAGAAAGNLYLLPIPPHVRLASMRRTMRHDPCYVPPGEDTNEPALTHSPVDPHRRGAADVAVQRWLGLLSERRPRSRPADPHRAGADTDGAIAPSGPD